MTPPSSSDLAFEGTPERGKSGEDLTPAQYRHAALVVCGNALNADDAREMLDALGLRGTLTEQAPPSRE